MVVENPIGVVVGKVEQKLTLFSPEYEVLDADDTPVFNIEVSTHGIEHKLTLFSPEYVVLDADDTPVFNIEVSTWYRT